MIKKYVVVLIHFALSGGLAHAAISSHLKADFEKTEQRLNTPELTPEQIVSYASDARCLIHLPCFNVLVWLDNSDVYFEVKNSKNRDVCRQTVMSSPEKVLVKTKCYRNESYEVMNNVIEFRRN